MTYQSTLVNLTLPDEARIYDDFVALYRAATGLVEAAKSATLMFLKSCDDALQKKQANPFEIVALATSIPEPIDLAGVNKQILAHNARTANFEKEIRASRAVLEEAIVADKFERVVGLEGEIITATADAAALRAKITDVQTQVLRLDGEIKEHRRPAQQINTDLASYLGRKDITLDVEDAGYRIMRDGAPATRLSEGERTALAVIYFLKSLEDRSFDRAKGIVVIDDPVSSLDANALFYAFSFIQERTKNVGQVFVTTHNFGFLKLVRKWFFRINRPKEVKKTGQQARFYMITCEHYPTGRCAELKPLDRLLQEYESEYHYLFSKVAEGATAPLGPIESFYHFPNIARRVLEAFLAFRLPGPERNMHELLHSLGFDLAKTNRILNFLNAHSHNARPDDTVDHDESILLETPAVLADVLKLIAHSDKNHYTEMMKLVISAPAPATSANP